MQKFLSFYKNKKIIFWIFLFIFLSGIALPQIIHAQYGAGPNVAGGYGANTPTVPTGTPASFTCNDWLNIYCGLVKGAADALTDLAWQLAGISSQLFIFMLTNYVTNVKITSDPVFLSGWQDVMSLANMFIVLGLVVIGISFALRFGEYGSKKVLTKLIVIALLVNFSGLFCGLMIDAANITVTSFSGTNGKGISPTGSEGITLLIDINQAYNNDISGTKVKNADDYFQKSVFYAALWICLAITFLYLSFVFLERYAILAILFILSPLAFTFWIFPASKNLWDQWWHHFLKWTFVGVQSMFFIWLAIKITGTIAASGGSLDWQHMLVVLVIMIVGVKIAVKSSPFLANATMGLAKSAAGLAMGAVTGGAAVAAGVGMAGLKGLDQKVTGGKVGGAVNKMSSGVGLAMENLGIRKQGTTNNKVQDTLKESNTRIGGMDEDRQTQIATGGAVTAQGRKDKMAAIGNKVRNGRLGDLGDTQQQARAVKEYQSYITDRGGTTSIMKDALKQNPNIGTPEQLKETVSNMSPTDLVKNINTKIGYTPDVVRQMTNDHAVQGVFGKNSSPAVRKAFAKGLAGLNNNGNADDQKKFDTMKAEIIKNNAGSENLIEEAVASTPPSATPSTPGSVPTPTSSAKPAPKRSFAYRAGAAYGQVKKYGQQAYQYGSNALENTSEGMINAGSQVYKYGQVAKEAVKNFAKDDTSKIDAGALVEKGRAAVVKGGAKAYGATKKGAKKAFDSTLGGYSPKKLKDSFNQGLQEGQKKEEEKE